MTEPAAATREFYDTQYHFAQDAARPDERRIRRSLSFLGPLAGATHLDLGCGAGWAARLAHRELGTARTFGLDFSATALRLARGHTPEVLWVQADGTALPVASASIERLYCDGALEHFPDVNKGLAEIRRVLTPDGRAVVIVPNFYAVTEQPQEFRTHYWGWKRRLRAAGFEIDAVRVDWGPRVLGAGSPLRMLKRMVGKGLGLAPYMAYQFIFALRRA